MCCTLRVPVDIDRLLYSHDPEYRVWLRLVVDRAAAIQREINAKAEAA